MENGCGDEYMKLDHFQNERVTFVETTQVANGISCDIYTFWENDLKDLGIVTVSRGESTPKQKVLAGDKTEEIFLSGHGTLEIKRASGVIETYNFPGDVTTVLVRVGDVMQWKAADDEDLCFAEVCYPPYKGGRFEVVL